MLESGNWIARVKRLGFWSLVGATFVLAAEVTTRIDEGLRWATPLLAVPDEADLKLRDSLGTRGRPGAQFQKWRLNNFGFRGPDMTAAPAPGCTRVVLLGASETFGSYESEGKEYPSQLQDSLRNRGCFEVVNAAIPGIGVPGITVLWSRWVARFRPSVAIVYPTPIFYLSDDLPSSSPRPQRPSDRNLDSARPWWTPRLLQRAKSRVHYPEFIQRRRVSRILAAAVAGHDSCWLFRNAPADRLDRFVADLDSLVSAIRARGATPILLTHAMRFTVPPDPRDADLLNSWRAFTPRATTEAMLAFERSAAQATRDLGSRRRVQVVDVAVAMSGRREWFADFTHFTNTGAGVISGLIADDLRRNPVATALLTAVPGR